mgnify:FL=1
MNIFFPKKIIGVLAIFVFLVIFLGMPAIAGADVKSSCTDAGKAACTAAFGACCETQCCQDYIGGGSYCDSSPDCKTTPAERCHTQCLEKNCHGYQMNAETGECAECLDCCTPPAASMGSDKACQDHCKGEYRFDSNNKCCTCTGTSFTDEMVCKEYCAEKEDKSYQYDPNTPPYCTCVGENIATESICEKHCYPDDYTWDAAAEPSQRCRCVNLGDDDDSSLKGPIKLEVGIGNERTAKGISYYIGMVYNFAAAIVGVVAVVMIIIGGIQYSASAGNPAALASAKETITSAIIGLAIVLMSYLILGAFSGKFTNLAEPNIKQINIDEINSGDDKQAVNDICLSGEKEFLNYEECAVDCQRQWERNCTPRAGADNLTVYCCMQEKATKDEYCTSMCETSRMNCLPNVPCINVYSLNTCIESCLARPNTRGNMTDADCRDEKKASERLVTNPYYDATKCSGFAKNCKDMCQRIRCGDPTVTGQQNDQTCCCAKPVSTRTNDQL